MGIKVNSIFPLLTACLFVPMLSACQNGAGADAGGWHQQAVLVKVSPAAAQTISDSSVLTATAKSRHSVTLSPQVEGRVSKILVDAGQPVQKGTPLIEISPEKQAASVSSYKFASWSSAKDVANAQEQLHALESQRQAKVSNLKLAENNRTRYSTLCETGAVAKMEFDQRVNAYDAAKSDLDAIDAQIEAQKTSIDRMKHISHQAVASLNEQEVQLQYYTVRAPFDGTVSDIPVKLGNFVNTSTALTTVTQNTPLEIYVEVPVDRAKQLKKSTSIQLLDNDSKPIGLSRVFFIAPNVSPDSQTVLVKSVFGNEKGVLRADETLKAKVIWSKHTGVAVPTEAVCHQSGEDFMFLADKGAGGSDKLVARQVAVKLGDIEDSKYQVLQGIHAGDRVIVSGVQNLADKTPISIAQ